MPIPLAYHPKNSPYQAVHHSPLYKNGQASSNNKKLHIQQQQLCFIRIPRAETCTPWPDFSIQAPAHFPPHLQRQAACKNPITTWGSITSLCLMVQSPNPKSANRNPEILHTAKLQLKRPQLKPGKMMAFPRQQNAVDYTVVLLTSLQHRPQLDLIWTQQLLALSIEAECLQA